MTGACATESQSNSRPPAGDQFTAALLSRTMAITDHVTGHSAAVSVTRFFPAILASAGLLAAAAQQSPQPRESAADKDDKEGGAQMTVKRRREDGTEEEQPGVAHDCSTVLALASVDRHITVWNSAKRDTPVVELSGLFGGPVTDLAWGCVVLPRRSDDESARRSAGCVGTAPLLLACSLDGSVAAVMFGGTTLAHRDSRTDFAEEPAMECDSRVAADASMAACAFKSAALGVVAPADFALAGESCHT
jgi:hypothetical protein